MTVFSSVSVSNRPLWRLAWQRIRQRPLPYLLCVLGIALGVAMMVSIDLANGSAQRAFALSTDAVTGRTTHRIVAVSPTGVDEAVYSQLRRNFNSVPASPVVEGFVLAEELGAQPYRLVGLDLFAESPFRSYFGDVESRGTGFVQFLTDSDAIVLSQPVAEQYQLKLGDSLHLDIAGQHRTVRLVGTLDTTDRSNRRALSNLIFADIATAQELLGSIGKLSQVDLIVSDPNELAAIAASLPSGLKLETAEAQKKCRAANDGSL